MSSTSVATFCAPTLVADRELHGLEELAGVGRGQIELGNVFISRVELLLVALDVRLCLAHLFLRIGRIIGKERVARGDLLPLGHEDVATVPAVASVMLSLFFALTIPLPLTIEVMEP